MKYFIAYFTTSIFDSERDWENEITSVHPMKWLQERMDYDNEMRIKSDGGYARGRPIIVFWAEIPGDIDISVLDWLQK